MSIIEALNEGSTKLPQEVATVLTDNGVHAEDVAMNGDKLYVEGSVDGQPITLHFTSKLGPWTLYACDDGCSSELYTAIQNGLQPLEEEKPTAPMKPGEEAGARAVKQQQRAEKSPAPQQNPNVANNANNNVGNNPNNAQGQTPQNGAAQAPVDAEAQQALDTVDDGIEAGEEAKRILKSAGVIESFIRQSVEQMFLTEGAEGAVDRELQAKIEQTIEAELDNYSGCDHGEASNAAYEMLTTPNLTKEQVREIIGRIDSFDPYEGFDLGSMDGATYQVCQLLGISA